MESGGLTISSMFEYQYSYSKATLTRINPVSGKITSTKRIKDLSKQAPAVKADLICQQIASGKTITEVCTGKDWLPTPSMFQNWLDKDLDLSRKLIKAEKLRLLKLGDSLYTMVRNLESEVTLESKLSEKASLIKTLASTLRQLIGELNDAEEADSNYIIFEDIDEDNFDEVK